MVGFLSGRDLNKWNSTIIGFDFLSSLAWGTVLIWDGIVCLKASLSDTTSLSARLTASKRTCPPPLLLPSFRRQSFACHSTPCSRGDSAFRTHSKLRLPSQFSRLPPSMSFSLPQRRRAVRHRQLLMHYQEIVRMENKVGNDLRVITCGGRDLKPGIDLGLGRRLGKARLVPWLAFGTLYQYSSCT